MHCKLRAASFALLILWPHTSKLFSCFWGCQLSLRLPAGACRLWSPADLSLNRTIVNGPAWVTDCVFMPTARRLVATSGDRAVSCHASCVDCWCSAWTSRSLLIKAVSRVWKQNGSYATCIYGSACCAKVLDHCCSKSAWLLWICIH